MTDKCESCGQRIPTAAERIVNRLRQARQDQGINVTDLADIIGCNRQTLWRWEGGSTSPELPNLLAWATALGVPLGLKEDS